MNGFEIGVDLDRLADYVAGVLDPTQADEVASLIFAERSWARAHAELVAADTTLRARLAAEPDETMPADVAARLEAALARPSVSALVTRSGAVRRAGVARRVWVGAGAAVAVAAAAVVSIFVTTVVPQSAQDAGAPGLAEAPAFEGATRNPTAPMTLRPGAVTAAGEGGGLAAQVLTSGRNYDSKSLASFGVAGLVPGTQAALGEDSGSGGEDPPLVEQSGRGAVDKSLSRLADESALAQCLAEVREVYPGTPITVDFARYEGQPAVIVLLRQGTASIVVAVGPECGLDGDADELAAAKQ